MNGFDERKQEVFMKNNKIVLAIIALVCGAYVVGPDPLPVAIDDIIFGLISAANFLKMMKTPGKTAILHE